MPDSTPIHPDDEQRTAELLRTLRADASAPNESFLAELRDQSTAIFRESRSHASDFAARSGSAAPRLPTEAAESGWTAGENERPSVAAPNPHKTRLAIRVAMRLIITLAATSLAAVTFWFLGDASQASTLRLGDVLARLGDVDAIQLEVTRDGETAQVWVRHPGLVRWEDSPTQYRIARGSRLWRVSNANGLDADPETELAVRIQSELNPWFGQDGRVDLLAMLDLRPDDRDALLNTTPSSSGEFAGRPCHVYRRLVSSDGRPVSLEAFVDIQSEQLLGLTARAPDDAKIAPLAELTLIAMNPQVEDAKFRAPVKLADQDRIGKVIDTQGIVTLRPVNGRRWTPVCRQLLTQAGDWIRTDVRGANATTIELDSRQKLIIGPASVVEIITANEIRVHAGTVQCIRNRQSTGDLLVRGSGADSMTLKKPGKAIYRLDRNDKLTKLTGKPQWLQYYDGTNADDSIGSLIVNLDGREQSLSIGDHLVTIEVRDQIARTTIEETFVNHTQSRLEGQFHFPLPQDASISGFGMWIGGELIEADIVEKQRAREIYETILREKRDPGLLEWTGGNVFKARVFPIEPHSEKRIKITYTQVLPLRGNEFRYTYSLKSEMLQTNPLKDLRVRFLVNSAIPLKGVKSTTHSCRTQLTSHSAELEFTAQEYTPTRDFEVVCEVNHRENDVLVIPHRRGDDGYFLLQLMPPGAIGDWKREVIPDGEPLEVILLCDTSGSMDSAMRKSQAQFVGALLQSLGDKDQFTLATTDVETQWAFESLVTSSGDNVETARKFLDDRISLGWTDLDAAFAAVFDKATPGCQIIYVGDGIVTTVESDPAAFVNRLRRLWSAHDTASKTPPTFHAVSMGSVYESTVLKGIASLEGGSMRQIREGTTAQETALELLNEIAQPGLKNVSVEFRGVRVAAVYPEQLPNIAAGTQQILVGRYLPEIGPQASGQQTGEVVVTGLQNGKPVKFVGKIALPNAEAGNSFIPRLWARGRLDSLLQQGSNQTIQDEIIGLSEEFHIITPYTSLLVLETDADRERFGVKRRFEMRDGERFFADGRDHVNYDLRRQQMAKAGNWRLGLRRRLLAQWAGLGRSADDLNIRNAVVLEKRLYSDDAGPSVYFGLDGSHSATADLDFFRSGTSRPLRTLGESLGDFEPLQTTTSLDLLSLSYSFTNDTKLNLPLTSWQFARNEMAEREEDSQEFELGLRDFTWYSPAAGMGDRDKDWDVNGRPTLKKLRRQQDIYFRDESLIRWNGRAREEGKSSFRDAPQSELGTGFLGAWEMQEKLVTGFATGLFRDRPIRNPDPYRSIQWLNTLFPNLPPAPAPANGDKPETDTMPIWPADAIALSKSLLRTAALKEHRGGIGVERQSWSYHAGFDRLTSNTNRLELWSSDCWLTRDYGQGLQAMVHWADATQRGVMSEAFLHGRIRKSIPADQDALPFRLSDHSLSALHQTYRHYDVAIERPSETLAVLRCVHENNPKNEVQFTLDTERNVLVKQVTIHAGKASSTISFSGFVKVAGTWWATRVETTSADPAHVTHRIIQSIEAYEAEGFADEYRMNMRLEQVSLFLPETLPLVRTAIQAVADNKARIDDRFVLLLHFCVGQKWEEAFEQLRAWEKLAADKPGSSWVRIAVELSAARNEDARQRLVSQARLVLQEKLPQAVMAKFWKGADLFLANHIISHVQGIAGGQEYADIVKLVRPVSARQFDPAIAGHAWKTRQLQVLDSLGRSSEALALQKEMLDDVPGDVNIRTQHASRLNSLHRTADALTFLQQELNRAGWEQHEAAQLRFAYADILEGQGRYTEVLPFYQQWLPLEQPQSNLFPRLLTALVMNDKNTEADDVVRQWLQLASQPGELSAADLGKVHAAIRFCHGRGHNLQRYYGIDRRWMPTLLATAQHCIARDDRMQVVRWIAEDSNFVQSDEGDQLRGDIVQLLSEQLKKPAEEVKPTTTSQREPLVLPVKWERLTMLLDLLQGGRLLLDEGNKMQIRQVTNSEWKAISDAVYKWWEATPDAEQKNQLSLRILAIYSRSQQERRLPFMRQRIAEGPKVFEKSYRLALFEALLSEPWTEAVEREAFTLWPTLSPRELQGPDGKMAATPDSIRTAQLTPKLYQLVDAMLQLRVSAARAAQQDSGNVNAGNVDAVTRTEARATEADFLQQAREGLSERLMQVAAAQRPADILLKQWILTEKNYLDVKAGRNTDETLRSCWERIGEAPSRFKPPVATEGDAVSVDDLPKPTPLEQADRVVTQRLQQLLKQRAWTTLMYLASRQSARQGLHNRLLEHIDAGIARSREATAYVNDQLEKQGAGDDELYDFAFAWRQARFDALIAFDRSEELVASLKQWILEDRWTPPWRRALARLYAEQGDLESAITQLEWIEAKNELSPQDLASLTDWRLVMNQRDPYQRSQVESYKAMQEWQLGQRLNQRYNEISNGSEPTEIDETTLHILEALFEKTSQPASYFWTLRRLYSATRDFRLLSMVAETVLGRTQESTYSALSQLQSSLIDEVRDEATVDEMIEHIHKLRSQLKDGWTPRGADANARSKTLDLRALDLLESLLERKASAVLNEPGPHGKAALLTFKRAFNQPWQEGERLQYARFLEQIGAVTHERNSPALTPLADEQLRQIKQLFDDSDPKDNGGNDRVRIGAAYAQLLFHGYQRRQEGLTVIENALRQLAASHDGLVPFTHYDLVTTYSGMLQSHGQYAKAERYVQKHLDALTNEGQRWTYINYLNQLHQQALFADGRTSLGESNVLFHNLLDRLIKQCDTSNDSRRHSLISQIGTIFSHILSVQSNDFPGAREKLLKFANGQLAELLAARRNNDANLVQQFATIIGERSNAIDALAFLLDRAENSPPRFAHTQDAWQQHGSYLASYHHSAKSLVADGKFAGERDRFRALETRLLSIVLTVLRADLLNLREQNRSIYHYGHTYYWREKSEDFQRVAEDVLKQRQDSPRTITYVAEYLYRGLNLRGRAIDVMWTANRRGLLDDAAQLQLVGYLHKQSRHAESIRLLEPMIARRPNEMQLRALLVRAYFHGKRPVQHAAFVGETDAHFHKEGRWVEGNMIQFAKVLAETRMDERAAKCFEEGIRLHQDTHANRGIGNGTLSDYYQRLASVYSRLGEDSKAVDAAAGSVVSWGPRHDNRKNALETLKSTIESVQDMRAFVKSLDAKAQKTGVDSPLLRKMTGAVLQGREDYRQAIEQYRLSLELQPYDRDVHQWMLACFEKLEDNDGAIRQLLKQIDFDRHNPSLYTTLSALAERTTQDRELAERAATSIIEQAPNEAESHQTLAKLWEKQERWEETIPLWQRVAELRKPEPTGLLGLANAQIHAKDKAGAKATLTKLRSKSWPERFGDISAKAQELESQLDR